MSMMAMPRLRLGAIMIAGASLAVLAAACGGSSAKSAPAAAATPASAGETEGAGHGAGGRFGDGTPRPEIQTSIAQGTPPAFGADSTPSPDMLTSIAQGTPEGAGHNGGQDGAFATAIAQGTPASALRSFGGGGGARVIAALATVLGIDENQLRTELQAAGASIASVAAARGVDRPTLRQKLIDAVRQRLNDAVAAGALTQQQADGQAAQFEQNVDNTIDRIGGGGVLDAGTPEAGR